MQAIGNALTVTDLWKIVTGVEGNLARVTLFGLFIFAMIGLVFVSMSVHRWWRAFRVRRPRQSLGASQADRSGGFEFLGKTRDGVAIMRSGDLLFEFDSHAYPTTSLSTRTSENAFGDR